MNNFTEMLDSPQKLQLIGAASLHLASKLRETDPMTTQDVVYYTDDAYSSSDVQVRCPVMSNLRKAPDVRRFSSTGRMA